MPGGTAASFIDRSEALEASTGLLGGAQHTSRLNIDFSSSCEQAAVIFEFKLSSLLRLHNKLPDAASSCLEVTVLALQEMASSGLLC